jgi:hypothetical protein
VSANSCPNDVESLTMLLLKDLPNYANRVIQRSTQASQENLGQLYILFAGKPEFEPLKLNYYSNLPGTEVNSESTQQVFFTTLERYYQNNQIKQRQSYYWMFLVQTQKGWQLVMIFSSFGSSLTEKPPYPPIESSQGIIGQAVSLWLRDLEYRCQLR